MTQKAVDLVADGVDDIVKSHLSQIQTKLLDARENPNEPSVPVDKINQIFQEAKESSAFAGVKSKYLLDQFLEKEGAISAEKLLLGEYPVFTKTDPPRIVYKQAFAHVIPLETSLKQILSHPELLHYVENPPEARTDNVIRDLQDGSWFKNHPIFSTDRRALVILYYSDGLQTSNIAGAKPQNFTMCYWLLGNIPAHLRSTLRAVNVHAIVRTSHVKRFGMNQILSALVKDVKKLQLGVTFTINGERKTFRGSVLFVSGDTPAAQELGGFKEGVGKALHPCRSCMTSQDELQDKFVESAFVLRNKNTHEDQVSRVEDVTLTEQDRKQWSKEYGVTRRSEFCDLDDFDITKCLVHDLMHVCMEGLIPLECQLFLRYVVNEKKLVTLNALNNFFSEFNYGHLSVDRPSTIESAHLDNKLRQSSMQTLALVNALPFAVKGRIESDPDAVGKLNNLILLMQITNLCMSFEFDEDDLSVLENMIQCHHVRFKLLYPGVRLVPKSHYLIHFVQQIRLFGPLRFQWCLRFEAAHLYFKRLMQLVLSYKNPVLTMMYRYCCKRANLMMVVPGTANARFLDLGDEVRRGPSVKVSEHAHRDLLRINLPTLRENDVVLNAQGITVKGVKFQPTKSVILLRYSDEELPVFGRVELISVFGNDKILFYRVLKTLDFDCSLNAYRVCVQNNVYGGISVRDLPFPAHAMSIWRWRSEKYVVLLNFKQEFMG